ncbi:MAG: hypothetical protein GTO63_19570, partial [Anaerolineae bacterium]|nr:hypothetical protein [Anaerolineae bacterium]NIN96976.1 hypothetical protein [Anaerolineae bacterium]
DGATPDQRLSEAISKIKGKYRKGAQWSYQAQDLGPLEAALGVAGDGSATVSTSASTGYESEAIEDDGDMADLMAMQAQLLAEMQTSS